MRYIPYSHQSIDAQDIRKVIKVLKSDWITQGPKIKEFEDSLCRYTGAKYALAVSSGTAALHLACLAAGIKKGDEVITSPVTFAASSNCVLYCGGKPVFADIQADTANIDHSKLRSMINRKTKAVIPVHFAGHPCDLKKIDRIAKEYNLTVIEDAAHALGAGYGSEKIGSGQYSRMTVFSFHPLKSITTGEGGAVLTNRKDLYTELVLLRSHGIEKKGFSAKGRGSWRYEMRSLGYNYRITDIQAALGLAQMKKLDRFILDRRAIAGIYNRIFKDNPYFDLPVEKEGAYSAYHLYPVRLKGPYHEARQDIFMRLRKKGLGVQVHYLPVYLHPYYRRLGYPAGLCPEAENFYQREISIPLYPGMRKRDILYVANVVLSTMKKLK